MSNLQLDIGTIELIGHERRGCIDIRGTILDAKKQKACGSLNFCEKKV